MLFTEKKLSGTVTLFTVSLEDSTAQWEVIVTIILLLILMLTLLWSQTITVQLVVHTLVIAAISLLWVHRLQSICEESIMIIRDFGIQLSSKNRAGIETKKFLDDNKIERVFIHEAIRGSGVYFNLAFHETGVPKLHLSFKHVYPGFESLQKVFAACVADDEVGTGSNRSQRGYRVQKRNT